MATWREVIEDENYQKLSTGEKIKTKNEFFNNVIAKSDKYKSLPQDNRIRIASDFFTPKTEEGLKTLLPEKPTVGQIAKYATEYFQTQSPFAVLDKPVEELARFIEPDSAKPGIPGALEFFPRQIASELLRGYKPSTAGAFGLGMKAVKPIAKPVGQFIASKIPQRIKEVLARNLTVGKGQPQAYQEMVKETLLERQAGAREAEDVAKVLTVKPTKEAAQAKELLAQEGLSPKTQEILKKKALETEPLTKTEQQYVGRIFRKEIDIGGKLPRIAESPELTRKIAKNVEVEVAFNPKVKSLQDDLELINKSLRDKETLAEGLVGKEFRTDTGFIEKATEVSKIGKTLKSGKPSTKRFDIGIVSEPVSPVPPTASPIPSNLLRNPIKYRNEISDKIRTINEQLDEEGISYLEKNTQLMVTEKKTLEKQLEQVEHIIRTTKQVSKLPTTNKFQNLSRQSLLQQRKVLSKQLQNEIKDVELGVRSNYHLFNREFTEQIRNHPKYRQLSSIADEGRAVMDKWSTALANSGIPKEQTQKVIEENIGSYMARMYSSKLKPQEGSLGLFKNLRLRLNGLKHRKDLSAEVLNAMGEIKEPALPTAIRVKEISTSIANNKLFNKVAQNPEWVAGTNVGGKLIKMPDSLSVGALKGKWVIPEIAEDINAITNINKQSQGMYLKALSAWKYGKVVLNPAAQARNVLSNAILLDLSGTNHLRQAQLFPKAFTELLSKGKLYKQAIKDGAIGGEFIGTETMQKLKDFYLKTQEGNLQKFLRIAGIPFKIPGELYQGMEQSAKLVKYMDVLGKTGNSKLAAQEAQKWLFNYNEIPKFIDWARKSPLGAPFITFTYKSIPRIAEAMVNRPLAVYKYKALFDSINETSRKYQGMTPVDYSRQKKLLPSWVLKDIGGMPTNVLLPWKDQYSRTQWLNLEYILPIGQAPEMLERGLAGFVGSPAFNITADIIKNMDFRGKQIVPPEATKTEAAQIYAEYIYRQLAPSLAPGGYSYEKIRAGLAKEPEKFNAERTRTITPALLDTLLGIKINPLDVEEAEQFKWWDKKKRLDALKQEFYRIINNPVIKEEYREKKIEGIFKKQEKVLGE